jgi:hypothetical protein
MPAPPPQSPTDNPHVPIAQAAPALARMARAPTPPLPRSTTASSLPHTLGCNGQCTGGCSTPASRAPPQRLSRNHAPTTRFRTHLRHSCRYPFALEQLAKGYVLRGQGQR